MQYPRDDLDQSIRDFRGGRGYTQHERLYCDLAIVQKLCMVVTKTRTFCVVQKPFAHAFLIDVFSVYFTSLSLFSAKPFSPNNSGETMAGRQPATGFRPAQLTPCQCHGGPEYGGRRAHSRNRSSSDLDDLAVKKWGGNGANTFGTSEDQRGLENPYFY